MKIDFNIAGEAVECKVTISVPYHDSPLTWTFTNAHGSKTYAAFSCNAMATQMRDALEKIRKEAYEQGWKDRGRKSAKKTWFNRWWA